MVKKRKIFMSEFTFKRCTVKNKLAEKITVSFVFSFILYTTVPMQTMTKNPNEKMLRLD